MNEEPITRQYFTGEAKNLKFVVSQDDDVTPQNITGWSLSWMVKEVGDNIPDSDALITKTTAGGGITLTTPSSGICTVTLAAADIVGIKANMSYRHELKRVDASAPTVLSQGLFILQQAVHE